MAPTLLNVGTIDDRRDGGWWFLNSFSTEVAPNGTAHVHAGSDTEFGESFLEKPDSGCTNTRRER